MSGRLPRQCRCTCFVPTHSTREPGPRARTQAISQLQKEKANRPVRRVWSTGEPGENGDVKETKNKLRLQSETGSERLPSSKALATLPRCAECRAGCLVNVDVLVLFQITLPVSRGRAPGLRRYANCRRRKPDGL